MVRCELDLEPAEGGSEIAAETKQNVIERNAAFSGLVWGECSL